MKIDKNTYLFNLYSSLANILICLAAALLIGKEISLYSAIESLKILFDKYSPAQAALKMFLPPSGIGSGIAIVMQILFKNHLFLMRTSFVINAISIFFTFLFFILIITNAKS